MVWVLAAACAGPPSPAVPDAAPSLDAAPGPDAGRGWNQMTSAELWGATPVVVVHESPLRVEWRIRGHSRACDWPLDRDRHLIRGLDASRLAGPPPRLGEILAVVNRRPECDYDGCVAPPPPPPEVARAPGTELLGAPTLFVHEAPGRPTLYVYADGALGWDRVRHARLRREQVDTLVALFDAIGPAADVPIDGDAVVAAPTLLRSRGGLRRVLLDGRDAAPLAEALATIERQLDAYVSTFLHAAGRERAEIVAWTGAVPLAALAAGVGPDDVAARATVPPRLYQRILGGDQARRYFRDRGQLYALTAVAGRFDYASLQVEPCVDAREARHGLRTTCFVWPAASRLRLADALRPGGIAVPADDAAPSPAQLWRASSILQGGQLYYGVASTEVERGEGSPYSYARSDPPSEAESRRFAAAFVRASAGPRDHALARLAAVCATLPGCAGACRDGYAAFGRGVALEVAFARCAGVLEAERWKRERRVTLAARVGAALHDYADVVARERHELVPLLADERTAGWLPPSSRDRYGAPCAEPVTLPVVF